jgi:pheromone shutdown protein TraB
LVAFLARGYFKKMIRPFSSAATSVNYVASDLKRVVFVPVIHTDIDSVEAARRAVTQVRPDVVAVELDRERFEQLTNPNSQNMDVITAQTGDTVHDLMNQIAILEKELGTMPGASVGEEMLGAIDAGKAIGAKIALVDRPIQATAQALMAVPLDEIYRLTELIPAASEEIEKGEAQDFMSLLKEDGAVDDIMKDFRSEFPILSQVLIEQRDEYIAKALSSILDDVEGQIVAVLGAGHIDGVTKALIRIIETRATD